MVNDFFLLRPLTDGWQVDGPFGLVDPEEKDPTYVVDMTKELIAHAIVTIKKGRSVRFIPIDRNDQYDEIAPQNERRCDAFLHSVSRRTLVFVELKARGVSTVKEDKNWIDDAIEQLRQTIYRFAQVNKDAYMKRECLRFAYAANRGGGYRVRRMLPAMQSKFLQETNFILKVDYIVGLDEIMDKEFAWAS